MTTYELMLKIKDTLEGEGFITSTSNSKGIKPFEYDGKARREEKSWIEKDGRREIPVGYIIRFKVVHALNGRENKSVDVMVYEDKDRFMKKLTTERFNVDFSERQFQNRIKKVLDYYDSMELWEKADA